MNTTGVFRPIMPIVVEAIRESSGVSSAQKCHFENKQGDRIYSTVTNSDSMRRYQETGTSDALFVAIDVYVDGTTLSKSGSQKFLRSASTARKCKGEI